MTFEEKIEQKIRKRFAYYKGSVHTKHVVELVRSILTMAGVPESNDDLVEKMAEKVIEELPLIVDLGTTRGWINRHYE